MPFTPSYKGTSYEWDESQVSKDRHRKKKCKITALSLNEHGPKGNLTSDYKLKKNPLPTLLLSVGLQVSKHLRGKGNLLKLNPLKQ